MTALTRRDFVKAGVAAGGGLTLAVYLDGCAQADAGLPPTTAAFAPNAWLRITSDGAVTVVVDRSEMGQGSSTGLPMLVAEELDADWNTVRFEQALAHDAYINPMLGVQGTGGSSSIRSAWVPLREASAKARLMLVAAAAQAWGVDPATCRTERSHVIHDASNRRLGYGELADRAGRLPAPAAAAVKSARDFRVIGTAPPRLDVADKTRGRAQYGIDVRLPGMLVAVVARSPSFGGKLEHFDGDRAARVPGVRRIIPISTGVGVLADNYWAASEGRRALQLQWDGGEMARVDSAAIRRGFEELAKSDGVPARQSGTGAAALAGAARTVEAVYETPYLAHATMEPMNCTAHVMKDRCVVWAPTQNQTASRRVATDITRLRKSAVEVHTTYLGGGFGRRAEADYVRDAVELSKAAGVPVKVVWSREDDIQHDYYRPATYNVLRGALDGSGKPVAWTHHVVGQSIMSRFIPEHIPEWLAHRFGPLKGGLDDSSVEGAANHPYAIPNVEVRYSMAHVGVPVGFWRSVGNSQNGFVVESFVDELAHAAGEDPFAFRRALLADAPRHRAVLELAAEKAGWGTPLPPGRGRGIAVVESFGSYVAQVAEVSVEGDAVRVHRVVCALDCGVAVHPDEVRSQMEGGIVYGLTAALKGEITLKGGAVEQSNFHDYQVLRMNEMPLIEVHLIAGGDSPGGVGEPGTPPIAPAVTNAVFALTGRRIRSLPIRLGAPA